MADNTHLNDKVNALAHVSKFRALLGAAVRQRHAVLTGVLSEYNTFSGLPEENGVVGLIFDAAFDTVSAAVPLLRIGRVVKLMHAGASKAIKTAEAAGRAAKRSDKLTKALTDMAQKGADVAEKAKAVKDAGGSIADLAEATGDKGPVPTHVSKELIREMLADEAYGLKWADMVEALLEIEYLLRDAGQKRERTLKEIAQELLPLPRLISLEEKSNEYDELWAFMRYSLVGAHIRQRVKLVTTIENVYYDLGRPTQVFSNITIEGLNNTQWGQIAAWFGPSSMPKSQTLIPREKMRHFNGDREQFARRFTTPKNLENRIESRDNGSWRRAKM